MGITMKKSNMKQIEWETIYPEIAEILVGPSHYLIEAQHNHERKIRDLFLDFGLTRTQFDMLLRLIVLTRTKKVVTQMDLANLFEIDKMLVSKVLRTLEKKGYIIREKHPQDSRAKSLVVTKKGLETMDAVIKYVAKFEEEFFSVLDNEDDLIRQLKKLQ